MTQFKNRSLSVNNLLQ